MIAASIAYVGIEKLFRGDSPKWRSLIAFSFGLVHGLGFADALRELGINSGGLGIEDHRCTTRGYHHHVTGINQVWVWPPQPKGGVIPVIVEFLPRARRWTWRWNLGYRLFSLCTVATFPAARHLDVGLYAVKFK